MDTGTTTTGIVQEMERITMEIKYVQQELAKKQAMLSGLRAQLNHLGQLQGNLGKE